MKPATAPTLSQHLLHEADRFFVYPQKIYRSKINLAVHKYVDDGTRRLIEWRRTFTPGKDWPEEFFASEVMLDQIYSRMALQGVPGMVERTRALRSLTLTGLPNAEYVVYLREAALCYVSGLDQAAIALARAAVENRLKQVCAKRFGQRAVETTDLKVLIDDVAARGKLLSNEARARAHTVRIAGNAVLHNQPDAPNAFEVLEAARDVITLLHGK
jgi:hypothetical protein